MNWRCDGEILWSSHQSAGPAAPLEDSVPPQCHWSAVAGPPKQRWLEYLSLLDREILGWIKWKIKKIFDPKVMHEVNEAYFQTIKMM